MVDLGGEVPLADAVGGGGHLRERADDHAGGDHAHEQGEEGAGGGAEDHDLLAPLRHVVHAPLGRGGEVVEVPLEALRVRDGIVDRLPGGEEHDLPGRGPLLVRRHQVAEGLDVLLEGLEVGGDLAEALPALLPLVLGLAGPAAGGLAGEVLLGDRGDDVLAAEDGLGLVGHDLHLLREILTLLRRQLAVRGRGRKGSGLRREAKLDEVVQPAARQEVHVVGFAGEPLDALPAGEPHQDGDEQGRREGEHQLHPRAEVLEPVPHQAALPASLPASLPVLLLSFAKAAVIPASPWAA